MSKPRDVIPSRVRVSLSLRHASKFEGVLGVPRYDNASREILMFRHIRVRIWRPRFLARSRGEPSIKYTVGFMHIPE